MDTGTLLQSWAAALGGIAALRAVPGLHRRGRVRAFGAQGRIEEWVTASGGLRQQFVLEPGLGALLAIDGDDGWIKRGPRAEALAGATGALYRALANVERLWAWLPDGLPGTVTWTGVTADGAADILTWRAPGAAVLEIHLRRDTHLPERIVAGETDSATHVELSDWRTVDGMRVAFKRIERDSTYGNEFAVEYEAVRAFVPPDPGWFCRPADDPPDYAFADAGRTPAIPFETCGNKIYFPVCVNGAPPAPFILDSGAAGPACLDTDYARTLGLRLTGAVTGGGAGAGTVAARYARGLTFALPGLALQAQVAEVAPLDELLGPVEGRRLYGLFGGALIGRFVLAVDYVGQTLRLHEPAGYAAEMPGERIPVTFDGGCPYVQATVTLPGCRPATGRFLVDLAADDAVCVTAPFVDAHGLLDSHQELLLATTGWGLGGELREHAGRGRLRIGGFEFEDAIVLLSQDRAGAMSSSAFAGVIGGEVLRRFDLVLAAPHGYLALAPNAHRDQPFEFDMSGLALRAVPADYEHVRVDSVRPQSPAGEAGLQPGDEIVAVDGHPARKLGLDRLRHMFLHHNRRYRLDMRRGTREWQATLEARRAI